LDVIESLSQLEESMGESNPESKSPSPLETKPKERPDLAKQLGGTALNGSVKK
jgi:hypothetical protein